MGTKLAREPKPATQQPAKAKSLVRQRLQEIPTDIHVPGEQTKAPPSEAKVKDRWTAR